MNRKKRIVLQVTFPLIIVVLMERFIGLPDYLNIVIYVILYGIMTFFDGKEMQSQFLNSNRKEKIIVCGIIGVVSLACAILLKYLLMKNIIMQMILQIIFCMICSICITIIICIVLSNKFNKRDKV